jgi:hypothetical protein
MIVSKYALDLETRNLPRSVCSNSPARQLEVYKYPKDQARQSEDGRYERERLRSLPLSTSVTITFKKRETNFTRAALVSHDHVERSV